jgi:hypothetical protein
MNVLEKLKAAIVRFIGIEDDPHDCPDPLAEACDPVGQCPGCKLLEEVLAERDELIAKTVAPPPAADNFTALKCRQVKPPEPLRPRYAMFYITMDLLAVTLLYILRSTEKTVYESIGAPLPGDSRIVQFVCHRQHMLLGIVLYSSAYAELAPDDPVPVLDVRVTGTDAREVRLTELFAPSLN